MPGADRNAVLTKIRKLRILAADISNGPEALAAQAKVKDLMRQYGISADELREPKPKPAAKLAPKPTTPAVITLKVGNLKIRWRL